MLHRIIVITMEPRLKFPKSSSWYWMVKHSAIAHRHLVNAFWTTTRFDHLLTFFDLFDLDPSFFQQLNTSSQNSYSSCCTAFGYEETASVYSGSPDDSNAWKTVSEFCFPSMIGGESPQYLACQSSSRHDNYYANVDLYQDKGTYCSIILPNQCLDETVKKYFFFIIF